MVLATEMTKHFEHVNKFVNSINKPLAALEENGVSFKKRQKEEMLRDVSPFLLRLACVSFEAAFRSLCLHQHGGI